MKSTSPKDTLEVHIPRMASSSDQSLSMIQRNDFAGYSEFTLFPSSPPKYASRYGSSHFTSTNIDVVCSGSSKAGSNHRQILVSQLGSQAYFLQNILHLLSSKMETCYLYHLPYRHACYQSWPQVAAVIIEHYPTDMSKMKWIDITGTEIDDSSLETI